MALRVIIVSVILRSPFEVAKEIAKKAQTRRLKLNLTQKSLADKSGVSYGTLKKFEQKGQISLESLLKIALVLGEIDKFDHLFSKGHNDLPSSLDELLEDKTRKRGRK